MIEIEREAFWKVAKVSSKFLLGIRVKDQINASDFSNVWNRFESAGTGAFTSYLIMKHTPKSKTFIIKCVTVKSKSCWLSKQDLILSFIVYFKFIYCLQ